MYISFSSLPKADIFFFRHKYLWESFSVGLLKNIWVQPCASHRLGSNQVQLCISLGACRRRMWTHLQYACLKWVSTLNTSTSLATPHLFLPCLHTFNYSDVVCYTATSTILPLFYLPDRTMINTTFVNNPRKRHAGNLSQYSSVTKLLFKLLQYFKALIFLMLLIYFFVLAVTFRRSRVKAELLVRVVTFRGVKGDGYIVKPNFCDKLNRARISHFGTLLVSSAIRWPLCTE